MVSFFNITILKTLRVVRKWWSPFSVLTLIWVDFLGVRFEVGGGGGGGNYTHSCLKLVRIMLEASNLARKYSTIFSFRKYTF